MFIFSKIELPLPTPQLNATCGWTTESSYTKRTSTVLAFCCTNVFGRCAESAMFWTAGTVPVSILLQRQCSGSVPLA